MTAKSAIEAEHISKWYRLGKKRERYSTLAATLARSSAQTAARLSRTLRRQPAPPSAEDFWALTDVSFDVRPGEVVGIIGRNGAGKSTLLKILARITDPTDGHAAIRGRIGSLLEVGTGFHLELTGRENVYLNGSILGMRRSEIDRKFDEIIAFAEVERFVDTQVKHYSSGMHLRLAFAVAAHLEPEILLVDEVLAVGDVAFQRKCLGKMGDVAAQGRTVLFVSHNLGAVKELCHSALVLSHGSVTYRGSVGDALAEYSRSVVSEDADGPRESRGWRDVRINGARPGEASTITPDQTIMASAVLCAGTEVNTGRLFCVLEDGAGNTLMHSRVELHSLVYEMRDDAALDVAVHIPTMWLAPGVYSIFFKFVGQHRTGADLRYVSERALLDVGGSVAGLGKALLAPQVRWDASERADAIA